MVDFNTVTEFESKIAEFFGAPYAVAVDSCTHGIELCLRYTKAKKITCPKHTYLSVPMLADKLNIELFWTNEDWQDFYKVTEEIYDAAVYWSKNGYIFNKFMCISFQFKKHLNLGRGGIILCTTKGEAITLKKMAYDGRIPNVPWREQDVEMIGYHYYMEPEKAALGLDKLDDAIKREPRVWKISDWPDISKFKVFQK
jgi:dTDP-4-amino-4,6-dideoxygalactose transaminase